LEGREGKIFAVERNAPMVAQATSSSSSSSSSIPWTPVGRADAQAQFQATEAGPPGVGPKLWMPTRACNPRVLERAPRLEWVQVHGY
jgi:hypothetical protein